MKSSGIRRGLAVAAIGAIAAVGVPIAAHANTIDQQMDNAFTNKHVTLYSFSNADQASTKSDGNNTTISLLAGATSDIDSVRFQFSTDGGATWTNIGPVMTTPNDDGAYSYEWNPVADSGLTLPAAGVLVRANGHSNLDGLDHPGSSFPVTVSSTFDTVSINPGSDLGYFKTAGGQDLTVLRGKSSQAAGPVRVGAVAPNGFYASFVDINSVANNWKTTYDIKPFYQAAPFGFNAPDQLPILAFTGPVLPASSDGESFTLYEQTIDHLDITANPSSPVDPNAPSQLTIKVIDQKGNPIAGVNVSEKQDGFPFAVTGVTNADGIVDTNPGTPAVDFPTQSVNDGTMQYIANDGDGNQLFFNPELGDKDKSFTLAQAFASSLVGSSNDGLAFDFDEQDGNDVQVQVKNQSGGNFDVQSPTQVLTYFWKKIPFSAADEPETGTSHVLNVETAGKYDIPPLNPADFPHGLKPGNYELYASLSEGGTGHPVAQTKVLTVKAGEAAVKYTSAKTVAPTGSTATVNGNLVLEDGTGLVGRRIHLDVTPGQEFDENGPTGLGDAILVSNANVTTGANGSFSAQVEDLSTNPSEVELNARLRATALPAVGPSPDGNWLGDPTFNFDHFLDFVTNQVPNGSVLDVNDNNTNAGPAGTLEGGTVHLEDGFGDNLAGVQVQLTVDHGFFTDGYKAPANGNYDPTPNSLGTSITVVTNAAGNANFQTSIGRDAGFDDDNHVIAKVSGAVGSASDNDTLDWNAANPLNVSEVSVIRTPGEPEVASTADSVLYDVFAKDQFGNPVRGVDVSIDCTQELGDDDLCPTFAPIVTQSDLDNGGDALLVSSEGGTFEYKATVTNPITHVFNASLVSVEVERSTTFQQEWYTPAIDEANGAVYEISSSPANPVTPGTPVTVTVKATDQQGNPLQGVRVVFVRTEDPDTETPLFTDGAGLAQYVFEPDTTCTDDTVTAVVRDNVTYDGDPADNGIVKQLSTVVSTECSGQPIQVALTGKSGFNKNGKPIDIMKVAATTTGSTLPVTGAGVHLMAKIDGVWVEIGKGDRVLDSDGKVKFFTRDRSPNGGTKYQAFVDATDTTAEGHSQVFKQR